MNARAWSAAQWAQTLQEAHDALVGLRPSPGADRSVWVSYYQRSSAVYRQVAEADRDHQAHAMYWAEREKAKGERLSAQSDTTDAGLTKRRRNDAGPAAVPSTLEEAHELLNKARPKAGSDRQAWLAYHQQAAAAYAEVAEVDRAHHYEALFFATFERRKIVLFVGSADDRPAARVDRQEAIPEHLQK